MGLFSNSYITPGKGVDPEDAQKRPFFLFWELIWRRFSRFIALNLTYLVFILPIVVAVYTFYTLNILELLLPVNGLEELGAYLAEHPIPLPQFALTVAFSVPQPLAIGLLAVSAVLYGPATCGLTYILRNFARQEHAWHSDFFAKMKENFFQGMVIGLMELAVYSAFFVSIFGGLPESGMLTLSRVVAAIASVLFMFMRHYFYVQIVTFKLPLKNIIKNAWIFFVLGFFRNLLVTAVIILTASILFMIPLLEMVAVPVIAFSFWGFLTTFTCWPVIQKYMIDLPAAQAKEAEDGSDNR